MIRSVFTPINAWDYTDFRVGDIVETINGAEKITKVSPFYPYLKSYQHIIEIHNVRGYYK